MSLRSNWLLVCLLLVAAIGGGALSHWILDAGRQPRPAEREESPGAVVAREFRLVDGEGVSRAVMSTWPDGACGLRFLDEKGEARAVFALWRDGKAFLTLKDKDGNDRAWLRVDPYGMGGIAVVGPEGKERAQLEAVRDGPTGLAVYCDDRREASLGASGEARPFRPRRASLTIGSDEKVVVGPDRLEQRSLGLFLLSGEGRERGRFSAEEDGGASLELCDSTGDSRASLYVYATGAALRFLDEARKPRVELETRSDASNEHASLDLSSTDGASAGMRSTARGSADVWCRAAEDGPRAYLSTSKNGDAELGLRATEQRLRVRVRIDSRGQSYIVMYDANGREIFRVP